MRNEIIHLVGEFKPSFRSGFGLVLNVVLGTGFDKFWEGENRGFGLTPPAFAGFCQFWNCRVERLSFNSQSVGQHVTD